MNAFRSPKAPARTGNRAPRPRPRREAAEAGFTLLETAIAGALLLLFLSSLFALNSQAIRLLHSATETADASQVLQTRVEQIRLTNWLQVVDPNYLSQTLMAQGTDADIDTGGHLAGLVEVLTVAPCQPPTGGVPTTTAGFTITRQKGKATAKTDSGFSSDLLAQQQMLQLTVTATWPSWGRTRTRSLVTMVSKWGISK